MSGLTILIFNIFALSEAIPYDPIIIQNNYFIGIVIIFFLTGYYIDYTVGKLYNRIINKYDNSSIKKLI